MKYNSDEHPDGSIDFYRDDLLYWVYVDENERFHIKHKPHVGSDMGSESARAIGQLLIEAARYVRKRKEIVGR